MSRTPFIAGNWKMYKTAAAAREYVTALRERLGGDRSVDVGVCPSFLALAAALEARGDAAIGVYAQTMHEADEGAFTGEVSVPMLAELGVDGVVLGHSERRQYFNETDRALAAKVPQALAAGLVPILCVGETEEERERGDTERKLRHQVQEALGDVPPERLGDVVIAYEPVWAIGTGLTPSAEQAQDAVAFVRALVESLDRAAAEAVRILYGGSLKPANARELLALPDVDGALVGGASLEVDTFAEIVMAARELVAST